MFPYNRTEACDAPHEEQAAAEGDPPTAAGDRPAEEDHESGLIAHLNRPSYLRLLAALWEAEEELERERKKGSPDPAGSQTTSPEDEEST
jgi:hypothetical protein